MSSRIRVLLEVVVMLPPSFVFCLDANRLEETYYLLSNDSLNINYRQVFFDAFPNNFDTFNYYFGAYYYVEYENQPIVNISTYMCPTRQLKWHEGDFYSYPNGYNYVMTYFESLPYINIDSFCNNTIRICFGGHYDADNISLFQSGVKHLALTDQYVYTKKSSHSPFWKCLNAYSDHEITSFWYFYLGYNERIDHNLYATTKEKLKKYPRLSRLLTQEYERMMILEPHWEGH